MRYCFFYLLLFFNTTLSGQNNSVWKSFQNSDSTLTGFKDKNGIVTIEPRFAMVFADKFDDIIAVSEFAGGKWESYYLTKQGKVVGRDSMHVFDNGFDCESEGFIRFRDKTTDKVGMFNRYGNIVIPAEYNDLTRVSNGMVIGLKDAHKEYWHKGNHEGGCNHFSWIGGQEVLIDTANNILLEGYLLYDKLLDFNSVLISSQPVGDSARVNFKSTDGRYYSFLDFKKEFVIWLKDSLLKDFSKDNLLRSSFEKVVAQTPYSKKAYSKNEFVDIYYELVKSAILQLNSKDCDFFILIESLNPYIFEAGSYEKFYNNCAEPLERRFPIMNIVINNTVNGLQVQDHFDFLKTEGGYRLTSVTIRSRN